MARTQTSLVCSREVLFPQGGWQEEADGLRSNLVSLSSQQMLGTIRINGLETQVRAIQKLPDYSKTYSLRRKRLIEAQNWKRGEETAIALIPGVAEELREKDFCTEAAMVCLQKREWASKPGCSQGLLIGPVALASLSPHPGQVAGF